MTRVPVRPLLALLTDFGTRDHYVASMKGVILGVAPEATVVDITHDVEPQDVLGGALVLDACVAAFPAGTVFVAVVDPGVGSPRRAIAIDAGGYHFVGPDNGLLSLAVAPFDEVRAVTLSNASYARAVISRTFEGRDRFAPAGAWLSTGVPLDLFGAAIDDWTRLIVPSPESHGDAIVGEVIHVDRFGNLITNVRIDAAPARVFFEEREVPGVATYSVVPPDTACAVVGSTGRLEIAVNGGSAAERFGHGRGARILVPRR